MGLFIEDVCGRDQQDVGLFMEGGYGIVYGRWMWEGSAGCVIVYGRCMDVRDISRMRGCLWMLDGERSAGCGIVDG